MARMAPMNVNRRRQHATGQGERLIRLTMALFYGQTISVHYIIRQFDVSPRTARRDLTHLAFVLESAGPHLWRLAPSLKP
ncbi:DeoR family transcriptional regulator [Enterobacter cloacae]|uniref:DeoR family transcriptional regulator n=1 Tax=Enterobacter cloacae TaxID=550 RepID=UPI001B83EE5A|nr:DeoR family transcriptional regulator [Enterobacter cloacae]HBC2537983.1 DeoR family transcriptional regulator [Enterobacter cloacae]HBC2546061.1 DeoR family transcriptional regulator [Enterobacter cloacae]